MLFAPSLAQYSSTTEAMLDQHLYADLWYPPRSILPCPLPVILVLLYLIIQPLIYAKARVMLFNETHFLDILCFLLLLAVAYRVSAPLG